MNGQFKITDGYFKNPEDFVNFMLEIALNV